MTILALIMWLATTVAALVPPPPVAPAPVVGTVAAGRTVYRQCAPCHQIVRGGYSTVGPNLFGVFDRPAGTVAGYRYSNALQVRAAAGLVWTEENLRAYFADPRTFMPGGSMAYAGLRDPQRMADLLAYLRTEK